MGVLDGKVVIVTGGARGIGRDCALVAAQAGAKVVVNDLGGSISGDDVGAAGPAEEVAREIRGAGGEAVSNSDSVATANGAKAMVEQALDTFKGLHAIISPAGILRDGMFHKMTDEAWQAVIDVHLNGTYHMARQSINHFREQGEGRYVFFTSTSGLIGNIGQTNYAAAKMGIVGLSRVLAMENANKNVLSNVIAPFAFTRMIASIPVTDEFSRQRVERIKKNMRADQVAQLAVALASPQSKVTAQIFCARGNEIFLFSQPRPMRGMTKMEGWTPETILEHAFVAMEADMYDLSASANVFSWDAI
jgi:NAD(P)-dependent dehydrogenase (short-subunit alcohol dehydrogenase family)